jgi:glucosamine--fructose-6-phosphate aminotransferase (isomerizing)
MCGIVAARTGGPVVPFLIEALELLEYRGYDSAGVSVRAANGLSATSHTTQRVDSLTALFEPWAGSLLPGTGIGHTRWATHGAVNRVNAHPHLDCTGRISVVHNGIIENAAGLRRDLESHGHVFTSDVDSEVIGHLVEDGLIVEDDLAMALTAASATLQGSWAIVVLDLETGRLAATAHRSPLVVAAVGDEVYAASDITAIGSRVAQFHALTDGDVVDLSDTPRWFRRGLPSAQPPLLQARAGTASTGFAGFDDHMGKEIAEQPEVAARTIDALAPGVADGSLWHGLVLPRFERVAVIGCGTSLNAGRVIASAFERLGGIPSTSFIASEAAETVIEPGTLMIALSQSGETADVLRAVDELDLSRSSLVAITNNEHSTLARRADSVLTCQAGPEIGVAATKTFVAQVVTGVATALSALVATGRMTPGEAARQVDDLRRLPDLLAHAIAVSRDVVPAVVDSVLDEPGFLFLGRGSGIVFAAEGALKLKELSYRWAEHYPAGELKHGPLALIQQGTPVVVIDSGERRLESNIAEVEARGGRVIRIGGPGSTVPALGQSLTAPFPGAMDRWGPLESVVPLQVLARELAKALGHDVDKPRNLAKSVTVE